MSTIAPPITDAQERVRRGAALLDEHGPEDWRDRVDLDRLDIGRGDDCILGQLHGGYGYGLATIGLETGVEHGFIPTYGVRAAWLEELGA